jgi:hypothetical protein
VATAQTAYPVLPHYRPKELSPTTVTSHGVQRPELAFVFGANWEFYATTSTSVAGRQKTGHTYFGSISA